MEKTPDSIRLFYQHSRLHTQVSDNHLRTLFRNNQVALAEKSIITLLLNTDQQYSVLGNTSESGLNYTTYGHTPTKVSEASLLGFCGQYRITTMGLYPLGIGGRLYSPGLMRFYSPDPLSPFSAGGFNTYGYCSGDPINFTDPSGKTREPLKRIASHQPQRYSSNPMRTRYRILTRREMALRRASEQAQENAADAMRTSQGFGRRSEEAMQLADTATNSRDFNLHLDTAEQANRQARHFNDASGHAISAARNTRLRADQLRSEANELLSAYPENFPPSASGPTDILPASTTLVPQQNSFIRQNLILVRGANTP